MLGPMNRANCAPPSKSRPKPRRGLRAGLVERILDDVGEEPGNLPLLEFALTLLWEQQSYGWMTHAGYERIGRWRGRWQTTPTRYMLDWTTGQARGARGIFVQLVARCRARGHPPLASVSEVGGGNWALVQRLADKRLVVTGQDAAGVRLSRWCTKR